MKHSKGKLIVIDGTDGTGKSTQTDLLEKTLKNKGIKVKKINFPQYNTKSAGLIEEYLGGKYGGSENVGPYRASIFYACDRYDASFKIKKWLTEGYFVISDRYTTANMGHQGGKIKNPKDRKAFFDWLLNLEYEIFQIPKPDLILILQIDIKIAQSLIKKRGRKKWLNKTKDIHEKDFKHLENAQKIYLEIAKIHKKAKLIKCSEKERVLKRSEIHKKILKALSF